MKIRFYCIAGGQHTKLGAVYYRSAKAAGGNDTSRYNRYMCGVLNAIAQTSANCDEYLALIEDVAEGRLEEIETGGNDVTLTIKKSGVHVDIEVNEDWIGSPDSNFTLDEWQKVLVGWKQFLSMPVTLDSVLEIDIS